MRFRILALVAALVPLAFAMPASADARVPRVSNEDLPLAGTCAPLRRSNVTHVLVGRKSEFGWYRIASQRNRVLNDVQLAAAIKQRAAGSGTPDRSEHSVWITAAKEHRWAHIVKVMLHCHAANIYRIGLRVQCEATKRVLGFPLFLPPPADPKATSTGTARELNIRVRTFPRKGAPKGSPNPTNLDNVYLAASMGVKKFGKLVASVRMSTNATVQHAVRVLDNLYRGGCAAVRVRITTNVASPKVDVYPVVLVIEPEQTRALDGTSRQRPPPVQPRSEPWGTDGANEAGWTTWELESTGEGGSGKAHPNYAARGSVPAFEFQTADAAVRNWAQGLSADLLAAARGGPQLVQHLRQEDRRPERVGAATQPVRALANVASLDVSTFMVSAYLYYGPQGVGIVDLLLHFAPWRVQLVYARWRGQAPTTTPVAFEEGPFRAGNAGFLRVWVEAMCLGAKTAGASALPMAESQAVLGTLPTRYHATVSRMIGNRAAELQQLVVGLRGTRFDRVVLMPGRVSASAVRAGSVVGLLNADVVPERGELRVSKLATQR